MKHERCQGEYRDLTEPSSWRRSYRGVTALHQTRWSCDSPRVQAIGRLSTSGWESSWSRYGIRWDHDGVLGRYQRNERSTSGLCC